MLKQRQISTTYATLDFHSWFRAFSLFFLICFCAIYPGVAQSAGQVGKITSAEGTVDILRGGTPPALPAKAGDGVLLKDIIRTKSNSKATITFVDGNTLHISQRSRIDISEYFANDPLGRRVIKMSRGKAEANVTKLDKQPESAPGTYRFEIHTPNAVAGVRGTQYIVYYDGNVSGIFVITGTVYVINPANPGVVIAVSAGYFTTVSGQDTPAIPTEATPEERQRFEEAAAAATDDTTFDTTGGTTGGIRAYFVETPDPPAPPPPPPPPPPPITELINPDSVPPIVSAVLVPPLLTNSQTGSFEFQSDEMVYYSYSLDGSPAVSIPGPMTTLNLVFDPLSDGNHTLVVTATDSAGNSSSSTYNWTTDYTVPLLSFSSTPLKGSNLPDASFTTSSSESVTYTYMLDGSPVASPVLTGLSEGSHTFTVIGTDAAGNTSTISYTWVYGTRNVALTGSVSGTGSVLTGTSEGNIYAVSSGDQAGWNTTINGLYTGPSSASWNTVSGGIGTDDVEAFNGYWLSKAAGTYSGNLMSGTSNFKYLSATTLGIGTGTVSGSYASGSWTAADTGLYTEIPLAFGSGVGVLENNGFIYVAPGETPNGIDVFSDSTVTGLTGLMGGTADLWSGGSVPFFMMGQYNNANNRTLWFMDAFIGYDSIVSDPLNNPCGYNIGCQRPVLAGWSVAGDALYGGMAGIALNNVIESFGAAIYIKSDGSTGYVLTNDINGSFYPDISMWEADGTLTVNPMGTTSILPSQLYDGSPELDGGNTEYGFVGGDISGGVNIDPLSIIDQNWGIWKAGLGGTYSGTPSSTWKAHLGWTEYYDSCGECWDLWGYSIAHITGDSWAGNRLSGTVNGRVLNLEELVTFTGPLLGTYDLPDAGTWQAVSLGAWSATPLAFVSSISSRLVASTSLSTSTINYATPGEYFSTEYYTDNTYGYERDYRPSSGSNYSKTFYSDGTWERYDYDVLSYTYGNWDRSQPVTDYFAVTPTGGVTGTSSIGPTTYTDSNFDSLFGGTDSLWTATAASPASVVMMGTYNPQTVVPHLWDSNLDGYFYTYSYDHINNTYTTYDGGAYVGILDGIDTPTADPKVRHFEGLFYGLYIDPGAYPNAHAGILKGNLTGNGYTDINLFEMDGTMFPVQMVTQANDFLAGDLISVYVASYGNTYGASYDGTFTAGGTLYGSLGDTDMMSISGEDWGVSRTSLMGTYFGNTSNNWNAEVDYLYTYPGYPAEAYGSITTGTQWSDNIIKGTYAGYYAKYGTTGIMIGETLGTFNPDTWQTVQIGAWMETQKFLGMACPSGTCNTSGTGLSANQTALKDLNVPVVQVGRATLTGSGNGFTGLTMTDAIFFAPSTGAKPTIWASGNVSGAYTAAPTISTPIAVSGGGLTANVAVQYWDTTSGKWLATVNGSGGFNGSTTFQGAAAGTGVVAGPGTITGTAAGVAK